MATWNDIPINSWNDLNSRMQTLSEIKQRYQNTKDPKSNLSYTELLGALTDKYPISSVPVPQPPGSLDISFGSNGFSRVSLSNSNKSGLNAMILQPDGKIIAAGQVSMGGNRFALVRYNTNGSFDTSFATNGYNTATPGTSDSLSFIALQSDGKIVGVGSATLSGIQRLALVRYHTDGTLDTTFGTNGFTAVIPPDLVAGAKVLSSGFMIQPDDKIIIGAKYGSTSPSLGGGALTPIGIGRYNSNGTLDTTFATGLVPGNGFSSNIIGDSSNTISAIARQSDGKIVAVGSTGPDNFMIVRYNIDGSLDTSFNTTGYNLLTPSVCKKYNVLEGLVIQPDGKIVACGGSDDGSGSVAWVVLTRYNSNGSLDISFATNGYNFSTPASYDYAYSIAVQSDSKIVVCGYAWTTTYLPLLGRYHSDGSLDTLFGTNGFNIDPPGLYDYSYDLGIQSDGKIVVVGYTIYDKTSYDSTFFIARYNP
jgi:uncharacterized delta-60 repeat protein